MTDDVRAALATFDRAFAAGDAPAVAEQFAIDAELLLQHGAPINGRPAIAEQWARLFTTFDTKAWDAEHRIVDVHGDRAYSLSVYSETLVRRDGGPSQSIEGRLIRFHRRDPDGRWRITLAMNAHARPVEMIER